MKKHIKEIAIKAGFDFDPSECNFYSRGSSVWINKEIYTFADLIIQRCISQIAMMGLRNSDNEGISNACIKIIDNIKTDFE